MQINKEAPDKHSIQSYTNQSVVIEKITYDQNLIVNKDHIITPWLISSPNELDDLNIQPILDLDPELILIGHNFPFPKINSKIIKLLTTKRIGLDFMSIGAACRTFNVLLSENRKVVAGLIFNL